MRSFFRALLRRRSVQRTSETQQQQRASSSNKTRAMAGGMTAAALYACTTITSPKALAPVPEEAEAKSHHLKNGTGFTNPWESWKEMSGPQILRAMIWRSIKGDLKWPDTTPPTVTVIEPSFLPNRTASQSLRATWLGHACYYVEFPSGLRVLFDPVFEDRCSPFSAMGPKRYTKTPCRIKDLPVVDVVVISHSHYDHLSHPTVLELYKSHPNAKYFVGLGLKKWFNECGIMNVAELDWWTDVDLTFSSTSSGNGGSDDSASNPQTPNTSIAPDITARISCLPCQHTSARTPFDKGHTLWCSWAVESGGKKVWFGGDTGYRAVPEVPKGVDDYEGEFKDLPHCPAFKQIGDLRGPFDLGLIPIGAYDPRHIMSPMHANPFDSVNIFLDTKCKHAMGIHWGTWVLTTEDVLEPPLLLKRAMKQKGLPETGLFDVCSIGESREF